MAIGGISREVLYWYSLAARYLSFLKRSTRLVNNMAVSPLAYFHSI